MHSLLILRFCCLPVNMMDDEPVQIVDLTAGEQYS